MARLCSFLGREDRVDEFFYDALPHALFCLRIGHGLLGVGCFPLDLKQTLSETGEVWYLQRWGQHHTQVHVLQRVAVLRVEREGNQVAVQLDQCVSVRKEIPRLRTNDAERPGNTACTLERVHAEAT